jgi:uncharacterized protein RhaS with RHS repeats
LIPNQAAAALGAATYDAANRQLTFGGQALTYDLNGNLIGDGTSSYTWDARNRLSGISGATTAEFHYDATGRRTRKTIDGLTTEFLYDGLNPVQEATNAGVASLLTGFGIDEFFMRGDSTGVSAFLVDALGSIVATTDLTAGLQSEVTYEAFGATVASGPLAAYRFTGREWDEPTGLYYYRARYYDRADGIPTIDFNFGQGNIKLKFPPAY